MGRNIVEQAVLIWRKEQAKRSIGSAMVLLDTPENDGVADAQRSAAAMLEGAVDYLKGRRDELRKEETRRP